MFSVRSHVLECDIMHDCVHGHAVDTTYQDEERGGVMIVGCPKEIKNEEYRVG